MEKKLNQLKKRHHPACYFSTNRFNMSSVFSTEGDYICRFYCDEQYQGYTGRMHGGILSALIDSAMTQCLFGHGIVAYTVRLNIKYSHPVNINTHTEIRVAIKEKYHNIITLSAHITQEGEKKVTAQAKFWSEPESA